MTLCCFILVVSNTCAIFQEVDFSCLQDARSGKRPTESGIERGTKESDRVDRLTISGSTDGWVDITALPQLQHADGRLIGGKRRLSSWRHLWMRSNCTWVTLVSQYLTTSATAFGIVWTHAHCRASLNVCIEHSRVLWCAPHLCSADSFTSHSPCIHFFLYVYLADCVSVRVCVHTHQSVVKILNMMYYDIDCVQPRPFTSVRIEYFPFELGDLAKNPQTDLCSS